MFVQTLEALPATYAERRRAVRRQPTQNTVCRLTDLHGDEIACGLVWNISATGVSMLLNVAVAPGTLIGADLRNAAGQTVRTGLSVVHLSPLRTGDYVLGGQFSEPLSESELRQFVAT
jgi:PilZ domain